ncbi:Structural maintenance of chromosomes protein [Quillaja saponaria]|uniref:Structural maintenance of chromosomes protein n=1 Tax=Quillaja saponaria TaxID=32244 RepID=A0AAD7VFX0_QUISA|nr:Structural maintenance of chromosomes protein [Quillaja saponaria]
MEPQDELNGRCVRLSSWGSKALGLFNKEMLMRNKQRIGPFHKSFSAVVGPHGGKKAMSLTKCCLYLESMTDLVLHHC